MSDREMLMELIHENVEITLAEEESLADHLISNGVTVQKWIPVSERLPKDSESPKECE